MLDERISAIIDRRYSGSPQPFPANHSEPTPITDRRDSTDAQFFEKFVQEFPPTSRNVKNTSAIRLLRCWR